MPKKKTDYITANKIMQCLTEKIQEQRTVIRYYPEESLFANAKVSAYMDAQNIIAKELLGIFSGRK